jgi:hypothetical protein
MTSAQREGKRAEALFGHHLRIAAINYVRYPETHASARR